MRSDKFSAKTIEEAVKKAADSFGVTEDQLSYVVESEPSKGFLGFGSKPAVIRAALIAQQAEPAMASAEPVSETKGEVAPKVVVKETAPEGFDAESVGKEFLYGIFQEMKLDTTIVSEEKDGYLVFDIQGKDLGILIGRRGDTLDALQFLLNLVINRKGSSKIKAIIDIENYRAKREETLIHLSRKLAEKAKRTGQKVILEPMNPQERRIIHMTLQEDEAINTYSEGEEPYRKVVIVPKKKGGKKK